MSEIIGISLLISIYLIISFFWYKIIEHYDSGNEDLVIYIGCSLIASLFSMGFLLTLMKICLILFETAGILGIIIPVLIIGVPLIAIIFNIKGNNS